PNYKDMEKFDGFLSAVTNDPDIEIITVKQLYDVYLNTPEVFIEASDYVPKIGTRMGLASAFHAGLTHFNLTRLGIG
ncbi:MAG: hypothetical protein JSV32_03025, partial [Dehalococcoidia bacterium]